MVNVRVAGPQTTGNDKDIKIYSVAKSVGRYYGLSEGRGDFGASGGDGIEGVTKK